MGLIMVELGCDKLLCYIFYVIMDPPDPDMTDGQSASQAAPIYSTAPIVGSNKVSQFATLIAKMMGAHTGVGELAECVVENLESCVLS
ncbi:hypothetical protein M5K25_019990 [Dendrobium thyrsiflorum]|uniref:Uncharacterized protein n=1 Tax=Dendrobium thyrsiflorum TaxID=117978 RepID=A0ABD0UGF1_DENTH